LIVSDKLEQFAGKEGGLAPALKGTEAQSAAHFAGSISIFIVILGFRCAPPQALR
jgi:hypothetical protein